MRNRAGSIARATFATTLVVALFLALPGRAMAVPVQAIVDVAEITYKMGCAGNATQVDCEHRTRAWTAAIKPGTGQEKSLATSSGFWTPPLDEPTMIWMADMHQTACGAPKAVNTFVHNVGALTKNAELQANIGTCSFVGGMYGGSIAPPVYNIVSWNRAVWAVLWAASLFAFFHILIGPTSGYVSERSPASFMAALGVFAAFGAISIGTWLYFRFRHPPVPDAAGPVEAG